MSLEAIVQALWLLITLWDAEKDEGVTCFVFFGIKGWMDFAHRIDG
jgi:hypothetical protein